MKENDEPEGEQGTIFIRKLVFTDEFEEFFTTLDDKAKIKHAQVFDILQTIYVLNTNFVKKLTNTEVYEMRVSVGFNEYRTILFAADHPNIIQAKHVVLLNGFLKKSTKDYDKQINKAIKILDNLEL